MPSLSPSPNPTVALYLFGSCFGDWVGLDCGPKDVCRASPFPLSPPYTPALSPQSAPHTPSLGPEQPLTPGQKSLWLSPYHTIHTDRDSNTPPPILSKCVHQDGFVVFLWGGAARVWEGGIHSELKGGQAGRQGIQRRKSPDVLKFQEWRTREGEPLGLLATCQMPVPRPMSSAEIVSSLALCPTAEKEPGKK